MSYIQQDWTPVVIKKKKPTKSSTTGSSSRSGEKFASEARKAGYEVETVAKFTGGKNKQKAGPSNAKKLEEETEELHHERVGVDFRKALQQARQAKGMKQSDLAKAINEKQTVINDYESGKAIPNPGIITKLERTLGCKLPRSNGKGKGK